MVHSNKEAINSTSSAEESERHYETHPTTTPALVYLVLSITFTLLLLAVLITNPTIVGSEDISELLLWVIAFVGSVIGLRLAYRMFILKRTTYRITDDSVQREYNLLYRTVSKELPYDHLWGNELTQSRIQSVLGYGTIRFLTGGNHRGLGFFEFEHVDDPKRVRNEIRTALDEYRSVSTRRSKVADRTESTEYI